jgi:hypothetical protein
MTAATLRQRTSDRPHITSYDTGYEHSVEHWFELKQQVDDAYAERALAQAADGPGIAQEDGSRGADSARSREGSRKPPTSPAQVA